MPDEEDHILHTLATWWRTWRTRRIITRTIRRHARRR